MSETVAALPGKTASILVVDDSRMNRKKISRAVEKLGHNTTSVDSGMATLAALEEESFDTILLDIVMPEMDGFEVLERLKDHPVYRDIPVIVISALDEETESVVRAIELGAEDFLPKSFDPILLRARLNASLSKKEFRDKELEYLGRVERLTQAAEVMEAGHFDQDSLRIEDLKQHKDALGRLAQVFGGMAADIYDRELKMRRVIQLLQGLLLVIVVGTLWGSLPALSRIASNMGGTPIAIAAWINVSIGIVCVIYGRLRGSMPKLTPSFMLYIAQWAVISGILQRLTLLFIAGKVEATLLALMATLQSFMVFGFAAATKMEAPTPRRLFGVLLGLIGVSIVLWSKFDLTNGGLDPLWLLVALALPTLYAIEWIFVAAKQPADVDIVPSVGIMALVSCLFLIPSAFIFEGGMTFIGAGAQLQLTTLLIATVATLSLVLSYVLLAIAGPVFASQSAYVMTIAGIAWGMILLNETLSPVAWLAVLLTIVGLILVSPKPSKDKLVIKRAFTTATT